MKPINLGIIGLGPRGRSLGGIVRRFGSHRFNLVAICDTRAQRLEQQLQALELPPASGYNDYHAMLDNPEIEAVMVQTGAQQLAEISVAALRAGKHVICDVPMMFTREEAHLLVATVEETGMVYSMSEQVRYANFAKQWKHSVEAGEIGEPVFIQGEYIHPHPSWYYERVEETLSGPEELSLADQARDPAYRKTWRNTFKHPIKYIPHELSPLLKIIDDRVTEVTCFQADVQSYGDGVEMADMECALMKTAKGRVIRIVNSFTIPQHVYKEHAHHWYHITGTEGFMENARFGWGAEGQTAAWNAITSISVPLYDIGARGAGLLIDLTQQHLAGTKEEAVTVVDELPAYLEPAASTAQARSGN